MQRVVGADVTRGLAVLGMFTAHVGAAGTSLSDWPTGLLNLTHGRSAATFALLAGLSAALLSGGYRPLTGPRMRHARVRVLVRAAALWPLGVLMTALGTMVAVILESYAVMFALAALALSWRRRTLLVAAGVVAVVGPVVLRLLEPGLYWVQNDPQPQLVDLLVGRFYPVVVWMAYLLVGMAVGRTDLLAPGAPRRLALWGVPLAVAGYGTAALGTHLLVGPTNTLRRPLLDASAHANSTPEVVGNIGVTLVVLALALLAAEHLPRLVQPLASVGALALTVYCGHLVAIAVLGNEVIYEPSNVTLAVFVVVALVAATLWRLVLRRGPLEAGLHWVSSSIADVVVPDGRRSGPGEDLTVEHREPAVLGQSPGAPGLGQALEGDVVGQPVGDGLPGEVRGRDPLGPQP